MNVFVGFGYNERDSWIKTHVFPILKGMGFVVSTGEDMYGTQLQMEVKSRIDKSDAVVGFLTIRDPESTGDFNSHLWVQNELLYGLAKEKSVIPVREENVRVPNALLGELVYVPLQQNDRLGCVAKLVETLGRKNIRRIRLEPMTETLTRNIHEWRLDPRNFVIRYRTLERDVESEFRPGRLEVVNQGFYLNVSGVSRRTLVDVEGVMNGQTKFSSGWSSVDAVSVKI